eukprot:g41235.t1
MLLAGDMHESMQKDVIILTYKQKREREDIRYWTPISLLNMDEKVLPRSSPTGSPLRQLDLRELTIPGSEGLQVKASLYMGDIDIFC